MGRLQRIKFDFDVAYKLTPEEAKTEGLVTTLLSRLINDLGEGAFVAEIQAPTNCFAIGKHKYIDRNGSVTTQVGATVQAPDGRTLKSMVAIRVQPVNKGGYAVYYPNGEVILSNESWEEIDRAVAAIGHRIEEDIRTQGARR
ncbi:hypothetical protein [Sorangium sp. So ce388]|uniref:hypothetical protein n=1 Tax=Sorangium sp. So ce388 TaxID=3133309 RepID=UPI003F5C623A